MSSTKDRYSIENTDYTVGQDNVQKWGFDVHNPVFGASAGLIIVFLVALLIADPTVAKSAIDGVKLQIIESFDTLFMWSGNVFLIFCIGLVLSPFGKIRIGGVDAKPEHSNLSWIAMLFAAGMGIGLMFWGVAEPVAYFTGWFETPLGVEPYTEEAAKVALGATMFHWGLHPWAIYAVVALAMAFFAFNKGLPLSIRSVFYPILGDRTWGWFGHIIDILAVLATLFGLATSLGLGAQQAASGISHVFGIDGGLGLQLGVIAFVTSLAVVSVVRGIDGGVKVLSNTNLIVAFALLMFVIIAGLATALGTIPTTLTGYVENMLPLSNPYGREDEAWMQGWTVFYWAWWVSWSPCVGMFIARISKGRTVREFLSAVILIPTAITLVWMSAFGGIAIEQVVNQVGELGQNGLTDITLSLFYAFDAMPMGTLLSVISIVLIMVFFITSSDSASLVVDSITSGGKVDAPIPQRIFWASVEGAIAAMLLWIGGTEAIQALQAGTISTGLPFTVILLTMCVSLLMGMCTELQHHKLSYA
ncbi:BCCT family transporter [Vibrio coralliilyticus]|uniref:BCCT family transporter n=1 Tax=Vibrio coralliilyticus TaxID=190893 RepID=UPI001560C5E9|nr:BCCT family transporter [Vibrio coralliilyticus]NRF29969.1 BCCT family transporter [Vibrio coralliilyticus]NRF51223.1 BCCT family transporter [Vibrio coralliilyticus]NRG02064.1 BCCT family transporter [Vibrio coralliilyticus]